MASENIVPNDSRTFVNKKFRCPEDYRQCEFYNPNQPEESRCQNDSSVGLCVKEFFDYYDKLEVIGEHGDIR